MNPLTSSPVGSNLIILQELRDVAPRLGLSSSYCNFHLTCVCVPLSWPFLLHLVFCLPSFSAASVLSFSFVHQLKNKCINRFFQTTFLPDSHINRGKRKICFFILWFNWSYIYFPSDHFKLLP